MSIADWGASALESLSRLGDWFGLGPLIDQAVSATGKVLSTAEVNSYIDKLVNEASKAGRVKLNKLNDQLANLLATSPKSNAYRSALQNGIDKLRSKTIDAENIVNAADAALNEAKTHAANIDTLSTTQRMDWGGKAKSIKDQAVKAAETAAEKYKELEKL